MFVDICNALPGVTLSKETFTKPAIIQANFNEILTFHVPRTMLETAIMEFLEYFLDFPKYPNFSLATKNLSGPPSEEKELK